jgi:hypothetical protein
LKRNPRCCKGAEHYLKKILKGKLTVSIFPNIKMWKKDNDNYLPAPAAINCVFVLPPLEGAMAAATARDKGINKDSLRIGSSASTFQLIRYELIKRRKMRFRTGYQD